MMPHVDTHGESMHASIWGVCLAKAKAKAVARSVRSNYVLFVKGFKKIEYKFVYQKNHHRSLIYKYSSLSKLVDPSFEGLSASIATAT